MVPIYFLSTDITTDVFLFLLAVKKKKKKYLTCIGGNTDFNHFKSRQPESATSPSRGNSSTPRLFGGSSLAPRPAVPEKILRMKKRHCTARQETEEHSNMGRRDWIDVCTSLVVLN